MIARLLRPWFFLPLLLLSLAPAPAPVVLAQDDAGVCPAFVEEALVTVGNSCGGMDRNSACYGYNRVDASFVEEVPEDFFRKPADRASLVELTSLNTAALDPENELWGVALMNVQANVPNTLPGQAVTFIMLGDVQVSNAVTPESALTPVDPVPVTVQSSVRVNLRSGPGTNFNVVGSAGNGQTYTADGRNTAADWLRLIQEDGTIVWISRGLVAGDDTALGALPDVTGEALTPMQAFYFSTGIGASRCVDAPDLLMIQGPENFAVSLTINGAEVSIGSTVLLTSESTDYATLRIERVLPATFDNQAEDDQTCLRTSMVTLDGRALLNDGSVRLLPGHVSTSISCLDEATGEADFSVDWNEPLRLPQSFLDQYRFVEQIPDSLLRYPVRVPTDPEIDEAIRRERPTPVPQPTAIPQPTRDPNATAVPTVDAPGATATPTEQVSTDPDCSTFRISSPFGTVSGRGQDFFWEPARNVQAYQVDMRASLLNGGDIGQRLFRVGANVTSINVVIDEVFPRAEKVEWYVQALVGAEPNWTVVCETGLQLNEIPR